MSAAPDEANCSASVCHSHWSPAPTRWSN